MTRYNIVHDGTPARVYARGLTLEEAAYLLGILLNSLAGSHRPVILRAD